MKTWVKIRAWYRNITLPEAILIATIVTVVTVSLFSLIVIFLSGEFPAWINAVASAGLFGIAVYGLQKYRTISAEKRPYVGVMKATAESNFTTDYQVKLTKYEKNSEEYKALEKNGKEHLVGQYVSSKIISTMPPPIPEAHHEIIVTLRVKNTGPIGAVDCSIHGIDFLDYEGEPPKQKYEELVARLEKECGEPYTLANKIELMPNQEQTYVVLIHRKQTKDKPLFLLLKLTYYSIKDKKPFNFYAVYVLSEFKAYTLVPVAQLRQTETV